MQSTLGEQYALMSDREFRRFSDLIFGQCGIHLPKAKKTMLSGRLRKRLNHLKMSFKQYYDYVSDNKEGSDELRNMLDAVSTNKTDFFREAKHFDFLTEDLLPLMLRTGKWLPGKRLNVWSAGCSSGEEPYTIAMVLADFASRHRTGDFSVLGTDISTRVLEKAEKGIYPESVIGPIPVNLKQHCLMKGSGPQKGFYRIVPELRSKVKFQRLNLNDKADFGMNTRMDIIFCRNVIIYFNRETQKKLFKKFYNQILPGGYLFIGHSESLHGINDEFKSVAVATYVKHENEVKDEKQKYKAHYR